MIIYPRHNWVFQKPPKNSPSFVAAWRGAGDFVRVKLDGTTVYESSADGAVPALPAAWYTLELILGGSVVDAINFGVGNVYVVAGQSNAVSTNRPEGDLYAAYANQPGRCVIFDTEKNRLTDAHEWSRLGACWIHAANYYDRPYPSMFVITARSNTSTAQWVDDPLFSDLIRDIKLHRPNGCLWHQGEADGNNNPATLGNMIGLFSTIFGVSNNPWIVALNSYPPAPGCGLRQAQQYIIDAYQHAHGGVDTDPIPRSPGDPHFAPGGLLQLGEAWGARMQQLYI